MVRTLARAEPSVVSAQVRLKGEHVDRWASAELAFEDGRTARIECSMWSSRLLSLALSVEGETGRLDVFNPLAPHIYHRLVVRSSMGRRVERVQGESTYACQLNAFVAALRSGVPPLTGGRDGIANMELIDAIYQAAGLPMRGDPLLV